MLALFALRRESPTSGLAVRNAMRAVTQGRQADLNTGSILVARAADGALRHRAAAPLAHAFREALVADGVRLAPLP